MSIPKVVLLVSLIAIALSTFTLGYVIVIRPTLSHTGSCSSVVTTYSNGYVEDGVCTYHDGSVCTFHIYHNNVTAGQQQTCK